MEERNTQIDSLKFFLIFLVLVGHCLDIGLSSYLNNSLFRFIYSFHMPVFVLLSGMMFKEKGFRALMGGGISLIATYLVFHLLYGGKTLAYTGGSVIDFWLKGFAYNATHLYDPADGLWYIISLLLWRLFLNYTPKWIKENIVLHLCVVLGISLLAGLVPIGREISFQRTFAFYPYFVLGYYFKDVYSQLRKVPLIIPLGVILIYAIIVLYKTLPQINILLQRTPYNYSEIVTSVLNRCLFYIWTLPISLSIIAIFPNIKFFSQEGRYTLFYYMFHMFFVLFFRYLVINLGLTCNVLSVLVYAIGSFVIMRLLRDIPILYFMTSPLPKNIFVNHKQ